MDNPQTGPKTGPETGTGRDALGAEEVGAPRTEAEAGALFRPGREVQRLADDWGALRRDAFLLSQKLRAIEARLVAIEGRSTGDAHCKLALLALVLQHDLGLAPDHRALRLARGALAALECVHRAVEPAETIPDTPVRSAAHSTSRPTRPSRLR